MRRFGDTSIQCPHQLGHEGETATCPPAPLLGCLGSITPLALITGRAAWVFLRRRQTGCPAVLGRSCQRSFPHCWQPPRKGTPRPKEVCPPQRETCRESCCLHPSITKLTPQVTPERDCISSLDFARGASPEPHFRAPPKSNRMSWAKHFLGPAFAATPLNSIYSHP